MKIYIGSDHAGFKLKEEIKKYFKNNNIDFEDLGNKKYDKNDDYPEYAVKVAKKVADNKNVFGILICGSSAGVCIVANKIKGIRAVSAIDVENIKKSRQHNNANVLCLSGWNNKIDESIQYINAFINTDFTGEKRHTRRLEKIRKIENNE